MAHWQCFVTVFSDEGGMVCPCTLDSQGGWWDDCSPYVAAEMLVRAKANVRLVGDPVKHYPGCPARFGGMCFCTAERDAPATQAKGATP